MRPSLLRPSPVSLCRERCYARPRWFCNTCLRMCGSARNTGTVIKMLSKDLFLTVRGENISFPPFYASSTTGERLLRPSRDCDVMNLQVTDDITGDAADIQSGVTMWSDVICSFVPSSAGLVDYVLRRFNTLHVVLLHDRGCQCPNQGM